jgi:hypothetical protein
MPFLTDNLGLWEAILNSRHKDVPDAPLPPERPTDPLQRQAGAENVPAPQVIGKGLAEAGRAPRRRSAAARPTSGAKLQGLWSASGTPGASWARPSVLRRAMPGGRLPPAGAWPAGELAAAGS